MHLYSNSLSSIAKISLLFVSELFWPCFSGTNNFLLSQSSSGSDGKNIVFQIPEAETIKPGDLGNSVSKQSRVDILPEPLTSKCFSFAKSYNNFLSDKLARSTL